MAELDIVGLDIPWFDEIVELDEMPGPNGSAPIRSVEYQGGGKVATALVAAARLGARCALVAQMGCTPRDGFLREDFLRHGIDVSGVQQEKHRRCGFSVVVREKESTGRRILWQSPEEGLSPEWVKAHADLIRGARYLHLCRLDEADRAAAAIAREAGVPVCLDGDSIWGEMRPHLPLVDILIGSEEFYEALFPEGEMEANLRALMEECSLSEAIFTFGGQGCHGASRQGDYFHLPAFSQNITVVDTVGAGDVFHGAFLAARCRGLETLQAARYASAVSAIKCTQPGGRAGIPTGEMALGYLETGSFDPAPLHSRLAMYRELSAAL